MSNFCTLFFVKLELSDLICLSFPSLFSFKVFADFEDYMKCQEKVSQLYQVTFTSNWSLISLFPVLYRDSRSEKTEFFQNTTNLQTRKIPECA